MNKFNTKLFSAINKSYLYLELRKLATNVVAVGRVGCYFNTWDALDSSIASQILYPINKSAPISIAQSPASQFNKTNYVLYLFQENRLSTTS